MTENFCPNCGGIGGHEVVVDGSRDFEDCVYCNKTPEEIDEYNWTLLNAELNSEIFQYLTDLSSIDELRSEFNPKETIIAYDDSTPVGFVEFSIHGTEILKININRLYVRHMYRNRGFATRLIDIVEDIGRANGCKQVILGTYLPNTNALALYDKLNFEQYYVVMHKKLE